MKKEIIYAVVRGSGEFPVDMLLSNANLTGADLNGADLNGADLTDAKTNQPDQFLKAIGVVEN